jgi:very-short-patch-repair endonuclease
MPMKLGFHERKRRKPSWLILYSQAVFAIVLAKPRGNGRFKNATESYYSGIVAEGMIMRYYCSVCNLTISEKVYHYSMERYGKAFCMDHQKTVTSQAIRLSDALKRLHIEHKLEYYDGYKHVDIAVLWAKLYIEIEGRQHGFNPKQVLSDEKRDTSSQKEGFYTKRIPNEWIDRDAQQVAVGVARLARRRYRQMKEKTSVIGKLKAGLGMLKTGYSVLSKVAKKFEDDEDFREDDFY